MPRKWDQMEKSLTPLLLITDIYVVIQRKCIPVKYNESEISVEHENNT